MAPSCSATTPPPSPSPPPSPPSSPQKSPPQTPPAQPLFSASETSPPPSPPKTSPPPSPPKTSPPPSPPKTSPPPSPPQSLPPNSPPQSPMDFLLYLAPHFTHLLSLLPPPPEPPLVNLSISPMDTLMFLRYSIQLHNDIRRCEKKISDLTFLRSRLGERAAICNRFLHGFSQILISSYDEYRYADEYFSIDTCFLLHRNMSFWDRQRILKENEDRRIDLMP